MIWQSPGLPGWQIVNFITVTRRPHHPNIAAGLCCLATSPGFLPTLCEKWSGFFYVHRVFLSYTRDRQLKVSSERLGNEDKAPCPRALLPGRGSNRGPPVWKSEALTARPVMNKSVKHVLSIWMSHSIDYSSLPCLAECTANQFQCDNLLCIPQSQLCDGTDNCRDNTDEINCTPGRNRIKTNVWNLLRRQLLQR